MVHGCAEITKRANARILVAKRGPTSAESKSKEIGHAGSLIMELALMVNSEGAQQCLSRRTLSGK